MTGRLAASVAAVVGLAASAAGQFPNANATPGVPNTGMTQYPFPYAPYPSPQNLLPNYYNRSTQPLSPYLNLSRGGNPAVNYFYGVRPGTVATGFPITGASTLGNTGIRQGFFPQASGVTDPLDPAPPTEGYVLPPAGHPTVFNNTLGYFPGGMGGNRSALSGFGASRRPAAAPPRPKK